MGIDAWPLFGVEVRTPRLVLRYVDDVLGPELVDVARRGIHDPAVMPFGVPWTDVPPGELGPSMFRFWATCRAELSPAAWRINLAVLAGDDGDERVIGSCDLAARDFAVTRWFETGSWLGRESQGRGLGTELRVACLHLGFVGLGARVAATGAYADNAASLGVTRKLGYGPNGIEHHPRRGEPAVIERFAMGREHFDAHVRRDDVELVGVDPVRGLLGLSG